MNNISINIGEGRTQISFEVSSWFASDTTTQLKIFMDKLQNLDPKALVDTGNLARLEALNEDKSRYQDDVRQAEAEVRAARDKRYQLEDTIRKLERKISQEL